MNLIRKLMGRRQFLIAAGATSTLGLSYKKLAGIFDPGTQVCSAVASEKPGAGSMKGLTNKYPHLLSPLRVRNKVLKNRIMLTPSHPHTLQGPENYPADPERSHYSDIAKNAAIVSTDEVFGKWPKTWPEDWNKDLRNERGGLHFHDHMRTWEDIPLVHNYLDQMIEDIHCEGSLICGMRIGGEERPAGDPSGDSGPRGLDIVTKAKRAEDKGYDAVWVGSRGPQNREALRPVIEQMQAVRKATNLIIVAWFLPYTPGFSSAAPMMFEMPDSQASGSQAPGLQTAGPQTTGPELEEVVAMAKMLEGSADILQMKDAGHSSNHPNSFVMEKDNPVMLRYSEAIKESGAKIITCPTGGFHYPELIEEWIASGKADMVGMATPLIADPEYVKKLDDGRGEDIVPCVMCHDCHQVSGTMGPWISVCTVNPKWGLSETKKRSIRPPTVSKKVAVIGGGPGGMKAAITAAERGHKVTLYEKDDSLGGLQRHTDYSQWTWAYKDFKDYLIHQVKKAGIEVQLNTTATPSMIKAKGYDAVLVALGSEPVIPRISGADAKNVYNIDNVYFNKKSLGKNIVIIGAGTYGTETGISLAKDGHKVTLLTSRTDRGQGNELIDEEDIGPHNKTNMVDLYQHHPNFSYIMEVTATRISERKVFYKDSTGTDKSIQADSVVIYAGLKPRMDEAMNFQGSAGQVLLLGDCTGQKSTIQKAIRSAFFIASQI